MSDGYDSFWGALPTADALWNEIRSAYRDKMRGASEAEKLPLNLALDAAKAATS